MAGRRGGRSVTVAAALVTEQRFGALPIDPRPCTLVDDALTSVLGTLAARPVTRDPRAVAAAVGAATGVAIGSPFLATHLTVGTSGLVQRTRALADALALGDQRGARRLLDRLAPGPERARWPHEIAAAPVAGAGRGGADGRVWPDEVVSAVGAAFAASVVGPALGARVGGAAGAGAAYALLVARPRHPHPSDDDPTGHGPPLAEPPQAVRVMAALAIAAARPSRAADIRAAVAAGRHAGATADLTALLVALGLTDADGVPIRPAEPGDVAAAARLIGDATTALALLLVAADAVSVVARVVAAGAFRLARRRR